MTARTLAERLLYALAALSLAFALVVGVSWMNDRARLRAAALGATGTVQGTAAKATALLDWVYRNQGFEKNRHYFLWRKLEATPIQVMEHGGDCADKSKLFALMLREVGIPGSLAMLYPCADCAPSHVVTLVRTPTGWSPMDAVFNVTFPDARGRLLDVAALRADPRVMTSRLDALVAERGATDKVAYYKRATEDFRFVTTANWDKNAVTRAVAGVIRFTGGEPWRTPRPLFLDDPKQLFLIAGLVGFALFGAAGLLVRRGGRGRPRTA